MQQHTCLRSQNSLVLTSAPENKGIVPAEYILYDLWHSMRTVDYALADAVLEPTFIFMRAQTDKSRLDMNGFGRYFEYREKDVGKGFVGPFIRRL